MFTSQEPGQKAKLISSDMQKSSIMHSYPTPLHSPISHLKVFSLLLTGWSLSRNIELRIPAYEVNLCNLSTQIPNIVTDGLLDG